LAGRRSHVRISGGTEWAASSLPAPSPRLGVAQHVLVTFQLAAAAAVRPGLDPVAFEAMIAGFPAAPAMPHDVAPRNDNACNADERR